MKQPVTVDGTYKLEVWFTVHTYNHETGDESTLDFRTYEHALEYYDTLKELREDPQFSVWVQKNEHHTYAVLCGN